MNEQEYLRQLADEADDTVDMLSSHWTGERERRAGVRCLSPLPRPVLLTT
jgi:hypothetical protein